MFKKLGIFAIATLFLIFATKSVYAAVQGDTNADNQVDGGDYIVWLDNYGEETQAGPVEGDLNNDRIVDGLDYMIWLLGFNSNPAEPLPTLEPTPEATIEPSPTALPTPDATPESLLTPIPTPIIERILEVMPLETPIPAQ